MLDDAIASGPRLWRTDGWRAEAVLWLDAALARDGRVRVGEVEQPRIRPWGTVLRAPTDRGPVWLKAMAPGTDAEAPLYEILARAAPAHVLTPIAVEVDRGWIVLPDGGTSLAEATQGPELLQRMAAALAAYAELQLALAPHVPAMLAAGVTDMRAEALTERFEEALVATRAWAHRPKAEEDAATYRSLAALRDDVRSASLELARAPMAATIDHNDLHPGNVLIDDDAIRFYDWGDSVIAHPFASALVPLTLLRDHTLRCGDDDPRLTVVRDAYLAPFATARGCTTADLVPTLELACRLAKIARALTWQRAIDATEPGAATHPSWEMAPFRTLAALLDPSPYGGA